jgi:choice-of-anchor B domain-containing protein
MDYIKLHFAVLLAVTLLIGYGCKSNTSGSEDGSDPGSTGGTGVVPVTSASCEDGMAGDYPCQNVDLLARVDTTDLFVTEHQNVRRKLNDIWGWKDPVSQKEYALVGLTDGVTFVDITNPNEPKVVGKLLESTYNQSRKKTKQFALSCGVGLMKPVGYSLKQSSWRDFKVYDNHLFVVSDAQIHGMQVFDLSRLRDISSPPEVFEHDELYSQIDNAHNIAINKETGYAYIVGATSAAQCDQGGLHMVDINAPLSPSFAGCFAEEQVEAIIKPGYVHDTQCVNYNGPDEAYQGEEVCFNASETALVIANVTDKDNASTISFQSYASASYSHQGWLTEDHAYYLLNDEGDENSLSANTRTYIWDVRDLDNPQLIGEHEFPTSNIDHNLYIKGNHVYEANYTNGLRILSLDDVANANLNEVAYFDTYPDHDFRIFDGAWSNYPFFDSGVVVVSDISNGLFILSPNL